MHRVQKIIANRGHCSRREAERLIERGVVKVNGKAVSLGDSCEEDARIVIDGRIVALREEKVYYRFYKPAKCVTSLQDPYHATIMKHLSDIRERVIPIGRLDFNTTGLLLLTNDGDFANKVMHPRYEVKKTYRVQVDRPILNNAIKVLRQGIELEDGMTAPAIVKKIEPDLLDVTIHEGRNRIIRRMFFALGYKVRYLERVRIGIVSLQGLKLGEFKRLSEKEKQSVFL